MALPLQIGDVIALANLCYNIAQAFGSGRKAAPAEFREVQNELYGLGQMLELLSSSVEGGVITTSVYGAPETSKAAQCLARLITNCQETVNDLKEFAKKYALLAGVEFVEQRDGVMVRQMTSKQRIKLNWKRIMWTTETSNIQGIRDRISIHVQSINAVVSLVNTHAIKAAHMEVQNLGHYKTANRVTSQHIAPRESSSPRASTPLGHPLPSSSQADLRMVHQEIYSLNHKMATIIEWQQRDLNRVQGGLSSEALQHQLSQILIKLEQIPPIPAPYQYQQPLQQPSPRVSLTLPYPIVDILPVPHIPSSNLQSFPLSPEPLVGSTATVWEYTDERTLVELPANQPSRSRTYPSIADRGNGRYSQNAPGRSEPVELSSHPATPPPRDPRGSRATEKDLTFELCIESRVKDGSAEFVMICPNARFHGNWIKAVQGGDYNEGLFECLCAPYQDEEDEFEPHGESLEAYYLTNHTIGCHYYGKVQWILHNVGCVQSKQSVTLGITNLSIKKNTKFERTFIEHISFRTAKNALTETIPSWFTWKWEDETEGDQLAILNSIADGSFSAFLETIEFTIKPSQGTEERRIVKSGVKHVNILHYKTVAVRDIQHSQTLKRDSFKYFEYVEILVGFETSGGNNDLGSLQLHLDETELDSNNSQDEKIVRLSVSGGKATFPGRANKVEKFSSFVEFKFKNVIGANEFIRRLNDMRNELHALKIQHAKRNEQVMVQLFADRIAAAADDIQMSGVEIVVVWDTRRKKGRILARARDGSCYLSQTLHLDFFKKFAELSRGNLFEGSAEFYQPANNPSDKVKKYNAGVGRIQFQDQTMDDLFYARLTESARAFGFVTDAQTAPTKKSVSSSKSDDKPILQRRVSQLKPTTPKRNYSRREHQRISKEVETMEDLPSYTESEIVAALPKQDLTRPLDAEELLDLLNQTEEKMFYTMIGPKSYIVEDPGDDDPNDSATEVTDEYLTNRGRRKKKSVSKVGSNGDRPLTTEEAPQGTMSSATFLTTIDGNDEDIEVNNPISATEVSPEEAPVERDPDLQKVFIPYFNENKVPIHGLPSYRPVHKDTVPTTTDGDPIGPSNQQKQSESPIDQNLLLALPRSDIVGETQNASDSDNLHLSEASGSATENNLSMDIGTQDAPGDAIVETEKTLINIAKPGNQEPISIGEKLSLPMIQTDNTYRAYRVNVDFNEWNKGTLLWFNESDRAARSFDNGNVTMNLRHFMGDQHAWIPRSNLKQERYYQMKKTVRNFDEGGKVVVKVWQGTIVVAVEDQEESETGSGADSLNIVPLGDNYSVVVPKESLKEVNLSLAASIP